MLLDKVLTNVNCCGIEVAFHGASVPSVIDGWQPFYNETFVEDDFQKAYASMSSIDFTEEGSTTAPGTSYKQKVVFRFPITDALRAERLALLHKLKFIKVKLTIGRDIVIGRNDITQNAFPNIKSKSNHRFCEIEVTTQSISPAGFTPIIDQYGLPVFIPLSF